MPDIARLVPHQPPMRLLDRLLSFGDERVVAEVAITPQTAFCEPPAGVPAWIGVEYLAQAAAAFFTLLSGHGEGRPRAGMLVACRRYQSTVAAFAPGALLRVEITPLTGTSATLVRFGGKISIDAQVASGEVSVYMAGGTPGEAGREETHD